MRRAGLVALGLLFALLLCAAAAHSGLGQCAICDCKVFTGGKTSNWWCTTCKHHYDQHYNNRKGPPAGLNPLAPHDGAICCE